MVDPDMKLSVEQIFRDASVIKKCTYPSWHGKAGQSYENIGYSCYAQDRNLVRAAIDRNQICDGLFVKGQHVLIMWIYRGKVFCFALDHMYKTMNRIKTTDIFDRISKIKSFTSSMEYGLDSDDIQTLIKLESVSSL